MYNIAKLKNEDRKILFDIYVTQFGGSPAIIEKDFWVSLMLDYIFNKSIYKDYFVFKGGTSLSKCYNIIDRFSEDIDLTLDHNYLGISDKELYNSSSKSNRKKTVEKVKLRLADFIKNKFKPQLEKDFKNFLIYPPKFEINQNDNCVLNFYYPNVYNPEPSGLIQCIRLEIGAIAELTPNEIKTISPLISKVQTPIFTYKKFNVKTITPVKTFWEKVLILHQETNRPLIKPNTNNIPYKIPSRYSRHYYDVYKLAKSLYIDEAIKNIIFLKHLIQFRDKFYSYKWNKIDDSIIGSIRLIPCKERINELNKDFESMKEMINDNNISSFNQIIEFLKDVEKIINK